jgi:O-antigen/teichoic acid export membrane protein
LRALDRRLGGLLREFLGLGSTTVLDRGSRLLTSLVAAAVIGPADWGVWFVVNLVIVYGSLTHLGSPNGMNLDVPAALGRKEEDLARRVQGASAAVLAVSLVATWVAIGAAAASGLVPIPTRLLLATGLLLTGYQAFAFVTMVLRARMRFYGLARLQLASALALPLLAVPATYLWRLEGFIVAQAAHYLLLAAAAVLFQGVSVVFHADLRLARRTVEVGFPIMLVGVVFALFSTVDRWVVVAALGAESLGHYSLAILALGAVGLLPRVVSQQIYPRMAFAWSSRGDARELLRLANLQRRFALLATLPVSAVLAAAAPWGIHTFLPEYAAGIPALLITLAIPVLYTFGQGYGNIFNVVGRRRMYAVLMVIATIVNAAASVVLVRPFGLVGVALGTLTGFVWLAVSLVVVGGRAAMGADPSDAEVAPRERAAAGEDRNG